MNIHVTTPQQGGKSPITLTKRAEERINKLLAEATGPVAGIRLSTPKRGCSGLSYAIDYVKTPPPGDVAIETTAGILFIDSASLVHLSGLVMDWSEEDFTEGFVFQNPNAKAQCGCGESFIV